MDIKDVQDELFRQEYPYLHADSDPDIERYCYLRSAGQGRDALSIYQFRLKPRYPDDTLRAALLRSYRSRDPLFPRLLAAAYHRLAERAVERILKIIDYISGKVGTYNKQDVYSTIKTIEDILHVLPREQYEAISSLDRMYRYAQVLDHQVVFMEQAAGLVRSYLSRSLPILEHERNRRRQNRKSKRPENAGTPLIDFSTVVFSDADLARIAIPGRFTRIEDQTLAYCMKYWNLINDAAFEQILFLYSRKYGKKNHAVYLTIRRGRNAGYRDEDILSSVMSMLVTGYYYSIQGDRYLQQNWQGIKNIIERAALPKPAVPAKPAPVPKSTAPAKAAVVPKSATPAKVSARPAAPPRPAVSAKPVAAPKSTARPAPVPKSAAPAKPAAPAKSATPAKTAVSARPAAVPKSATPARASAKPVAPPRSVAPAKSAALPRPAVAPKSTAPAKPVVAPKSKPTAAPKSTAPARASAKSAVPARPAVAPKSAAPAKPAAPAKAAALPRSAAMPKSAAPAKPAVSARPAVLPRPAAPAKPAAPPKSAAPAKAVALPRSAAVPKSAAPAKPVAPPRPASVKPAAPRPAAAKAPSSGPPRPVGGSVSDRLQKLSGRGYDLYQDRFLAHVRPAIRKILGAGRGIFFTPPEKAEDLVYHYLRDHYADPYMNWPESEERRQLTEQGFDLPSLDPVIDECFRKINRG